MPSPTTFRKGFQVQQGTTITDSKNNEFTIMSIAVGHIVKKQFEKQEFPMSIEFETGIKITNSLQKSLISALKKHTQGTKILYSEYGSPQECHFGNPTISKIDEEGNIIIVKSNGIGVRRRDIPTLKEQLEKKMEDEKIKENEEEEALKKEKLEKTYRIITSRFGTSKCASCEQEIAPGEKIGKKKSDNSRGNWSHLECLTKEVKITKKTKGTKMEIEEKSQKIAKPERKRKRKTKK